MYKRYSYSFTINRFILHNFIRSYYLAEMHYRETIFFFFLLKIRLVRS